MGRLFKLYNVLIILDNKTKTYASNAFKMNKKNKLAMEKEIEKLNINEPGRYILDSTLIGEQGFLTFNRLNY